MFGAEVVTRTKFLAPRMRRAHLGRERLDVLLDQARDLPLFAVVAGTGYGKSALLADYFERRGLATLWYALSERDADPQVLSLHLAHLAHRRFPGVADRALALLAQPGGAALHGLEAVERLADSLIDRLEGEHWLILDDFHHLHGAPDALALVNHLLTHLPPALHLVLVSRQRPELPDFARYRLQGDALTLDQKTLAFTPAEARALFDRLGGEAPGAEAAEHLIDRTEGWPMALQLLAQRAADGEHEGCFEDEAGSRRDLFEYLAREVFAKLQPAERELLLAVAPLSRLDARACGALVDDPEAPARLRSLGERGLFLAPLGPSAYRLHPLFKEFLLARLLETNALQAAHLSAARAMRALEEHEEAIAHLLSAGALAEACALMTALAPGLVRQGRFAPLGTWLSALPAELVDRTPELTLAHGDACRLAGRFDEAIAWYDRSEKGWGDAPAERAKALSAKAMVYLDTLQPALAEHWLQEALACDPDPARQASLRTHLAENLLNQGRAPEAERLLEEAGLAARPETLEHMGRILLRTGRLASAQALLRAIAPPEREGATKAHREGALILSFIEALAGAGTEALGHATSALERARRQGAAWTEAVALIREGHAHLVLGNAEAAETRYRETLALAVTVGVARLKAEPLMGLALVAGRKGQLAEAEAFAREGLDLAQATGDVWLSALLGLSLGAVYAAAGDPKAERWLMQAQSGFERCTDPFGQALCALWFARLAISLREPKALSLRVRTLCALVRKHDYGFLLERGTFLGFSSAEASRAFLDAALSLGVSRATLMPWIKEDEAAPSAASTDALRVRTLGTFRAWRGAQELSDRAWGREKARQLFHLLVAYRGQWLPKARLVDLLWPELDAKAADQTFRVALNALNKALEPERASGQPTRFVLRQGLSYGLMASPEVWIDAAEFERLLEAARARETALEDPADCYREALELYEGDFLQDFPHYDAWCEQERDRLKDRYSEAALRLSRLLAERGDDAGSAHWCQRLIEKDRSIEEAYRLLMRAYYRQGDRPLALRTYDRCVAALAEELDVDPMPETEELFDRISRLAPVTDL
ncbi:MAG TPA: BTAD domain-containing putative transcriptional regulator [Pantanalinema sp.]